MHVGLLIPTNNDFHALNPTVFRVTLQGQVPEPDHSHTTSPRI